MIIGNLCPCLLVCTNKYRWSLEFWLPVYLRLLDPTELPHDRPCISIPSSAMHLSFLPFDLMSVNHITSEKSAKVSN